MGILTDILKVLPLASTAIGSYFWIRRNVWSSHISIAKIAIPGYDYNEELIRELSAQRADSLIAWIYIVLSVFSQTILNFIPIPTTWDYSITFEPQHLFLFLLCCLSFYLFGNRVSRYTEERTFKRAMKIISNPKKGAVPG